MHVKEGRAMGSLSKMRILDMTQYEAGTSCTQYLAWLGADVVKIEPPTGDPGRGVGREGVNQEQVRQYFLNYNSNKRSVVINLKSDEGRQIFLDMVPHYDVFVENYGPGVVEKLGLDYETLSAINPSIIHARIKGYGLTGPYSQYNSYDWVAQASAGTFSVTGDPNGPPMKPAPTMSDSGTGIQMALGIVSAYVEKLQTGVGQQIEISMQEATTMFMRTVGLHVWGKEAAPRTGIHQGNGITSTYPCAPTSDATNDNNDWIFIMTVTSQMWDALCVAMERSELLTDEKFSTEAARIANQPLLYEEIASWTRTKTKQEVMGILGPAGVPASYVFSTMDLFTDPHLTERNFIQTVDHPINGEVKLMRNPLRMDGVMPLKHAPLLDDHTDEVLSSDIGIDDEKIQQLRDAGVIGSK